MLRYDHDLYVMMDWATEVLPLDRLKPTKPPASQRDSVAVATERLAEASDGRRDRRTPIVVTARYEIIDGNALTVPRWKPAGRTCP